MCPNDCSGHGLCRTVAEIASGALNKRFVGSLGGVNTYSGSRSPFEYRLWDAEKHTACICDAGYTGVDCSLRQCPTGADPLSAVAQLCGNAACRKEVQGFTVSGADANSDKNYAIKFYDYNGNEYVTKDFALTKYNDAANAAAVKAALQSLPNNVTGAVTVASTYDSSALEVRILVTFDMPGNVPEFVVIPGTTAAGSAPVSQPSQPVQTFTITSTQLTTSNAIVVTTFPLDAAGFRPEEFATRASANVLPSTTSLADIKTAISTALQSAASGATALNYKFGATGATLVVYTSGANHIVKVTFPSKNFGASPAHIKVGTNAAIAGVLDTFDGTYENRVCSDRGLCDSTSGLCKCFPGYTGAACATQNVLAM